MPRMTQAEYNAYLARGFKTQVSKDDPFPSAPEWKLHEQIDAECRRRGWFAVHSRMDKPTTTSCGLVDWIVCADGGRVFFVECKTRSGKLSTAQLGVFAHLEKLGHKPVVVRSLEQFLEAIGEPRRMSEPKIKS
jgi:hypothetical protein